MNTHSSYADCRMELLSAYTALSGGEAETVAKLLKCVTTDEAMDILFEKPYYDKVKNHIIDRVKYHLDFRLKGKCDIEFIMFTTNKQHTMESVEFRNMLDDFREYYGIS